VIEERLLRGFVHDTRLAGFASDLAPEAGPVVARFNRTAEHRMLVARSELGAAKALNVPTRRTA